MSAPPYELNTHNRCGNAKQKFGISLNRTKRKQKNKSIFYYELIDCHTAESHSPKERNEDEITQNTGA